jgi:nucleoside-diphosphate-sugar epimerase
VGKSIRDEADPFAPVSDYGASKLLGDGELRKRADRLPITSIQPGIVFGPHDVQVLMLYQMINAARLHLPTASLLPRNGVPEWSKERTGSLP